MTSGAVLMIDNYDSFTYNLVQYLGELGAAVSVYRNDQISLDEIEALEPQRMVISPGPCTPNEAGISVPLVERFIGRMPILGVCLGHQSIAQALGGRIVRAKAVMHGKTSQIHHNNKGVFNGLPQPMTATRYHSLIAERISLPTCLEVTAWTELDGQIDEIMGFRHRDYPLEGVQFHPESISTPQGHDLLANFLR